MGGGGLALGKCPPCLWVKTALLFVEINFYFISFIFSQKMLQRGRDNEGLQGFLIDDIRQGTITLFHFTKNLIQ